MGVKQVYSQESFDAAVDYVRKYYGFCVLVNSNPSQTEQEAVGMVDFKKHEIRLVNLKSKQRMWETLLHEIGHLIRGRKEESRSLNSNAVSLQDKFSSQSLTHKLAVLQEEFEAWDEGLALAKRKGWVIDEEAYNRQRTKCLKTYVLWCSNT